MVAVLFFAVLPQYDVDEEKRVEGEHHQPFFSVQGFLVHGEQVDNDAGYD